MNTDNKKEIWNVIYTRSRFEKKIYKTLKDRGYEVYLPLVAKKRKWSDRIKIVEFPLFPGYLFIKPTFNNYFEIANLDGVVRFLKYEGNYAEITEEQMQLIQTLVLHHQEVAITTYNPQIGDKIIIKTGPFANYKGIYNGNANKKSIYIHLESINKSIIIDANDTIIEKITEE